MTSPSVFVLITAKAQFKGNNGLFAAKLANSNLSVAPPAGSAVI